MGDSFSWKRLNLKIDFHEIHNDEITNHIVNNKLMKQLYVFCKLK